MVQVMVQVIDHEILNGGSMVKFGLALRADLFKGQFLGKTPVTNHEILDEP